MIIKSLPVIGSVIYGSKRPINEMFVSTYIQVTQSVRLISFFILRRVRECDRPFHLLFQE